MPEKCYSRYIRFIRIITNFISYLLFFSNILILDNSCVILTNRWYISSTFSLIRKQSERSKILYQKRNCYKITCIEIYLVIILKWFILAKMHLIQSFFATKTINLYTINYYFILLSKKLQTTPALIQDFFLDAQYLYKS